MGESCWNCDNLHKCNPANIEWCPGWTPVTIENKKINRSCELCSMFDKCSSDGVAGNYTYEGLFYFAGNYKGRCGRWISSAEVNAEKPECIDCYYYEDCEEGQDHLSGPVLCPHSGDDMRFFSIDNNDEAFCIVSADNKPAYIENQNHSVFVDDISQLETNIRTLDKAAQAIEPEAIRYICENCNFVPYTIGDSKIRTAPITFIGYRNNSIAIHNEHLGWENITHIQDIVDRLVGRCASQDESLYWDAHTEYCKSLGSMPKTHKLPKKSYNLKSTWTFQKLIKLS